MVNSAVGGSGSARSSARAAAGVGLGPQSVAYERGVLGYAVGGEGVEVAGVAFALGPDVEPVAEIGDTGVSVAEQMADGPFGARAVVDGHGVDGQPLGGPVDADDTGAALHRLLEEAVTPVGRAPG